MNTMLHSSPMFESRDVEATRAYLASKAVGLEVRGKARDIVPMDTRVNGVYLRGLWIGYIRYGAPVSITLAPESSVWRNQFPEAQTVSGTPRPVAEYWVHFPVEGALTATVEGQRLDCDRNRGAVASPTAPHVLHPLPNAARLSLEIQGEALRRQLAALLGDTVCRLPRFIPELPLAEGHGKSLAGLVQFAVNEIDRVGVRWNPLVATQFEQFVLTSLLLSQPNDYSAALRLRERPIASRDVRRAIEYIHENIGEAITLADLVAVSGVAGRTLIKHFRDFKGVSPMRYIRNVRLERVHEALLANSDTPVAAIAARWGFTHSGRFSVEYRGRYGESPSATLARRRH